MDKILVLATRNNGKVKELKDMLEPYRIDVRGLDHFPDAPNVVEDGLTFRENAIKKAQTISDFLNLPALADDSGLEVDALGGRPGVYSARFAGPNASDEQNIQKLIESFQENPGAIRTARFRCVLALAQPNKPIWTCDGTCEGEIILEPQGTNGFGYDPIFYIPSLRKTLAQLTKEEKNRISHRGKAMDHFTNQIDELFST